MGFEYAGNLGGAGAPVKVPMQIGETCYVGQLVQTGLVGGAGGHCQIADVATEASDDDQSILGFISGVVDDSRTYVAAASGTAQYGDRCTYTTTQATVASTGCPTVEVTLALPMVTLIRAPIYNAAWGTALTEQTVTSASSTGVTITAANNAVTDMADDYVTAYCRSGANRGLYRVVTTSTSTTVNTVTVPFPYGIAVGDVFVLASCVIGKGGLDFPASADCIDGNNDMNAYYDVFYHYIDLSESGKEYAIFSLWNGYHIHS